jgi:hypothetical protein
MFGKSRRCPFRDSLSRSLPGPQDARALTAGSGPLSPAASQRAASSARRGHAGRVRLLGGEPLGQRLESVVGPHEGVHLMLIRTQVEHAVDPAPDGYLTGGTTWSGSTPRASHPDQRGADRSRIACRSTRLIAIASGCQPACWCATQAQLRRTRFRSPLRHLTTRAEFPAMRGIGDNDRAGCLGQGEG